MDFAAFSLEFDAIPCGRGTMLIALKIFILNWALAGATERKKCKKLQFPSQKAESRKLKAEIIGSVSLKAQEKNLSGKMWKDAERSGTRRKTGDRSWEIGTKVSGCLNCGQSQVGGYDLDRVVEKMFWSG